MNRGDKMIKQIGTKIYYCLVTGNVIKIIGDMMGYVKETTFDEDIEIYSELKERDIRNIGLLQFEYGEYPKLSKGSTGVMVDLETKELIFSYEEFPQEPIEPTEIEIIQEKISILEAENSALLESQKVQDRTIVENDMRMMDLEWALEDLITSINPTAKINLTEVFTMFGRSATYFNQLKQMIEMENYDSKEDMERILNKYAAGSRPRITQEEYDQLFDLLYPPVYDIPTTIPEV